MAAFAAINDLDGLPHMAAPGIDLHGLQVVDVRTPSEQQQLPLEDAIPIPVDEIMARWSELNPLLDTMVVCHSGKRAHVAAATFKGRASPTFAISRVACRFAR